MRPAPSTLRDLPASCSGVGRHNPALPRHASHVQPSYIAGRQRRERRELARAMRRADAAARQQVGCPQAPPAPVAPSTSSLLGNLGAAPAFAAGCLLLQALAPDSAHAGESLPLEFVRSWLEYIEGLGPWGAVAFVASVVVAEMIPLFPTQPLSLMGGLLFGGLQGGTLVWLATSAAAVGAFSVSRTVSRGFAKRMIDMEGGEGQEAGVLEAALKSVNAAIEHGGFWRQYVAIVTLRCVPVLPFSATNYLLGLTPLPFAPFLTGSMTGMFIWSFVYASVGGASRALLRRGVSMEQLFKDMGETVGQYTQTAAVLGLVLAATAAAAWGLGAFNGARGGGGDAAAAADGCGEPLAGEAPGAPPPPRKLAKDRV